MGSNTPNHSYGKPTLGGDTDVWGEILNNQTIDSLEEEVPIVDDVANIGNYTPYDEAIFIGYDSAKDNWNVYIGDGSNWNNASLGTQANPIPQSNFADIVVDKVWGSSAFKYNYPYPWFNMEKSTGSGSVTFNTTEIQIREPGNASAIEESIVYDDLMDVSTDYKGSIRFDLSNITIDNTSDGLLYFKLTNAPGQDDLNGDEELKVNLYGNGDIFAITAHAGTTNIKDDTSQDNTFITNVNYVKMEWDPLNDTLDVTVTDGSTTVTISQTANWPDNKLLNLQAAARDENDSSSTNVDMDINKITIGTP